MCSFPHRIDFFMYRGYTSCDFNRIVNRIMVIMLMIIRTPTTMTMMTVDMIGPAFDSYLIRSWIDQENVRISIEMKLQNINVIGRSDGDHVNDDDHDDEDDVDDDDDNVDRIANVGTSVSMRVYRIWHQYAITIHGRRTMGLHFDGAIISLQYSLT